MIPVCRFLDFASCGDPLLIGSLNVLVNFRPCGRLIDDSAGDMLIYPGNFRVLVNNMPICKLGDTTIPHKSFPHPSDPPIPGIMVTGSWNVVTGP